MLNLQNASLRILLLVSLCAGLWRPVSAAAQVADGASSAASNAVSNAASAPLATMAKPAVPGDPVLACERAARQLLASKGAPAVEVKFRAAPAILPGAAGDKQWLLRGAGSWRSAQGLQTFSYTCNVDASSAESVGMVMRDTTPASTKAKLDVIVREPDLTYLSPGVCESAVAVALKKRSPRVSEISFESATRSVKQTSAASAELQGRGRALPEIGSPTIYFGFACNFDTRDGRLLSVRLSG